MLLTGETPVLPAFPLATCARHFVTYPRDCVWRGGRARFKAQHWKCCEPRKGFRGFKSHPLRHYPINIRGLVDFASFGGLLPVFSTRHQKARIGGQNSNKCQQPCYTVLALWRASPLSRAPVAAVGRPESSPARVKPQLRCGNRAGILALGHTRFPACLWRRVTSPISSSVALRR